MMFNSGFAGGFGRGFGCGFGFGPMHSIWGMGIGLVLFALLVYLLVRKNRNSGNKSALQALDMRFASGELSEEEYLQRKSVLKNK